MASLESLRFLFITGKGGAGKSTVAAALSLALADRSRRVLVAQCGKDRLSTLFGSPPIATEVVKVRERVWAVVLGRDAALDEYGALMLKSRRISRALFENRTVRSFLRGVPGLNEWAMLGKAWYHSVETLENGQPRFDVVLVDAPATGHGLGMLRVPKVILEAVPSGLLRRDAQQAWGMFADPRQTGVLVVTLAEEMPTNETIELFSIVRDELELPIARLIINCLLEPVFSDAERLQLLRYQRAPLHEISSEADSGKAALQAAIRRAAREQVQQDNLRRLQSLGAKTSSLPMVFEDPDRPSAIERLARELSNAVKLDD